MRQFLQIAELLWRWRMSAAKTINRIEAGTKIKEPAKMEAPCILNVCNIPKAACTLFPNQQACPSLPGPDQDPHRNQSPDGYPPGR